jgi:ABC-type transporter Mla maintaining outer membrane lipid asymmetry permease subunit MlaE
MSAAVARALATDIPSGRVPFREFVAQAWFVLSVFVLPTLLVTVPFGVTTSIQVGSRAQQLGAPPSPRSPSPSDLPLAEAKSAVFGLIVGLVACHEGLTTRGRPRARRTR